MTETLYRVEQVHGGELSFPVHKAEALDQVRKRIDLEPLGDPLRIVRIDYRLSPEQPPQPHTGPMVRVWRATVVRFPMIGTLGVGVCKPASQHRYGNAGDWAAPPQAGTGEIINYLGDVFDWHRHEGIRFDESNGHEGLPTSEVIFRDKIATRAHGWRVRDYDGQFHYSHEHVSCYPLIDTSRPCS